MSRPLAVTCAMLALFLALPVSAATELDNLARELDRTESVRAVKTLQSSYAQYAQYGLWNVLMLQAWLREHNIARIDVSH